MGALRRGGRPGKLVGRWLDRSVRARFVVAPGRRRGIRNRADELGGAVAQLGERLTGSQEVDGSIPFSSTILSHGP